MVIYYVFGCPIYSIGRTYRFYTMISRPFYSRSDESTSRYPPLDNPESTDC